MTSKSMVFLMKVYDCETSWRQKSVYGAASRNGMPFAGCIDIKTVLVPLRLPTQVLGLSNLDSDK